MNDEEGDREQREHHRTLAFPALHTHHPPIRVTRPAQPLSTVSYWLLAPTPTHLRCRWFLRPPPGPRKTATMGTGEWLSCARFDGIFSFSADTEGEEGCQRRARDAAKHARMRESRPGGQPSLSNPGSRPILI